VVQIDLGYQKSAKSPECGCPVWYT